MRVTKEQAAENRRKILDAAAALFRERGLSGVGMDALAEAAGLTHGSLYSQFGSKDQLAVEALRFALDASADNFANETDLASYVTKYLSIAHRESPGQGCALAALGSEIPRSSSPLRAEFASGVRRTIGRISALLGARASKKRDERAIAAVATMVGAIVLARAVDEPDFAERIIRISRDSILRQRAPNSSIP